MATQYTTRLLLEYWQKGDRDWHVQYADTCAILEAMEALATLSVRPTETPSTTLNVAVAGGSYVKSDGTIGSYAGTSSQALTLSAVNYLYLTDAGVLTVNTTGWPATTFHVRLATVTTDATTVTAIGRERVVWSSAGKDRGALYLPLTGGTFNDASGVVTITTGTTNGTKFGAGATGKLGFWGATPIVQPASASQAAAAALTTNTLTNTTTGTATTTVTDVGAAFSQSGLNNIHATLVTEINHLRTDVNNLRTLLNQIRGDLVSEGLIKGSA